MVCMGLRLVRMLTLSCASLVVGLAFAHAMELPRKLSYGYEEYARTQHSLYAYFAYVGGPLEVLSIVLAAVWVVLVRRRRAELRPVLLGAVLLAVALAEWAVVVQGANGAMAGWDPAVAPSGWTGVRDRWEYGHVAHFLLLGAGFTVLLWSALRGVGRVDRPAYAG